jgi:hypothetical protein
MLIRIILAFYLLSFSVMASSALVWPMQAGTTWEFTYVPLDGSSPSIVEWHFNEPVTLGPQQYFLVGGSCFRSAENEIYECDSDGSVTTETLFFQTAPIGTTWSHGTNNTVEILDDNFLLEDVYGGPYEAYQLQFTDPSGFWNVYVVPGVGPVKSENYDDRPDEPHNIMTLTNIVPLPAAAWLFCSGLIGLIGLARRNARN